jgi:hypothetical protein
MATREGKGMDLQRYPVRAHIRLRIRRLAGFPVNICYADLRGEPGPKHAIYDFDPGTFVESSEERRMCYHSRVVSPSWVSAYDVTQQHLITRVTNKALVGFVP